MRSLSSLLGSHDSRHTTLLLLDKSLRLVVVVVIGAVVARYLGPSRFGLLEYSLSLTMLFAALSRLGLDNVLVRELVRAREDGESTADLFGSALALRLAGSAVLVLASQLAAALIDNDPTVRLLVLYAGIGYVFRAFQTVELFYQATLEGGRILAAAIVGSVAFAAANVVAVYAHGSLPAFGAAFAAEHVARGLILIVLFAATAKAIGIRPRVRAGTMRRLLRDAWPLALSGIVVTV